MPNENVLETLLREFRQMKGLSEKALAQVDDDAYFATFSDGDNSIAIIVKHLAGNMRSRWRDFLTTDGEKPDRDRDTEFIIAPDDTRTSLTSRWQSGWQLLFEALKPLTCDDLNRTVTIWGEPMSVLQAVVRQLTHYSYHVGQLILLAKHHAGDSWQSLSIQRGESARFNENPTPYLSSAGTV